MVPFATIKKLLELHAKRDALGQRLDSFLATWLEEHRQVSVEITLCSQKLHAQMKKQEKNTRRGKKKQDPPKTTKPNVTLVSKSDARRYRRLAAFENLPDTEYY